MTCRPIALPGGGTAIVCFVSRRTKRCKCGALATLLCDWKAGAGKTCDRPLCAACAEEVAEEKHLCREHQAAYRSWLDARRVKTSEAGS